LKVLDGDPAVAEDLVKQSWPNRFVRVLANHSVPAVFMTEEAMAASGSNRSEARPLQSGKSWLSR
jgi:hypothetical protein